MDVGQQATKRQMADDIQTINGWNVTSSASGSIRQSPSRVPSQPH